MKILLSIYLFLFFLGANAQSNFGILSSQIGYDVNQSKKIFIRSDQVDFIADDGAFEIVDLANEIEFKGQLKKWGEKWNTIWWIADFSEFDEPGEYILKIVSGEQVHLSSDTFKIGDNILWDASYDIMAHDFLQQRAAEARTGKGWRDCGSDLQEFSSHVVAIDGLCDVLEVSAENLSEKETGYLQNEIIRGCDFLAFLQDKAKKMGLGDGAVIHEDRQDHVVTGNVAKAAMIFAKSARLIGQNNSIKSDEYKGRAEKDFQWIHKNGPLVNTEEQKFFASVHGAPIGSVPPENQWMTRDLVTMTSAAIELAQLGEFKYKALAKQYAQKVMVRQVPKSEAEFGLFGHFYTYGDYSKFGNVKFTEKANIHCGAHSKDGRMYNKGGHFPHYILPLLKMVELWGNDTEVARWKECIEDFAYGYFVPACKQSPFLILPAGVYNNQGLMYFGSWYHGHNNIYSFAASMALEFEQYFNDSQFREIAVGNIQWIAGLNVGLKENNADRFYSYSMISGIGNRSRGSWTKIPGTICNGFSASPQFRIEKANAETDLPLYFDDEGYIAHTLPFIGALVRLKTINK